MKSNQSIKRRVLEEVGQMKEHRIRFYVSKEQHAQLILWSIEHDLTMTEYIRMKLFNE
jgi:hypothetical protein